MKDGDKKILQDYIEYGNRLNESCEKLRVFLREQNRIEELENELAKLISIVDKIAAGFDYPREHLLVIVDKSKFIYQKGE